MAEYRTSERSPHGRAEYLQWARILSQGNPVHGMILVFVQKLCTALHEFAPAWENGLLEEEGLPYVRERLAARTRTVLSGLEDNGLADVPIAADFRQLLASIGGAQSMAELADLSEVVHELGHATCDWLERAT